MSTLHHANKPGQWVPSRQQKAQGGFVITLELLLLVTILLIGTLVGIVAIRDALIKRYVGQQSQVAVVVDAQGRLLGEAVGFDEHDAPRLFYIDRTQSTNYRTLIGVRDDRFTSREPLYYAGNSCEGDPCIKSTSDEATDNNGVDGISGSGSVSYFNALQGQPNYAVGRGVDGLPGALFRESPQACPVEAEQIGSRWVSQSVVSGKPCEVVNLDQSATEPSFNECLVNTLEPCSCPESYEDEGDVLANYLPLINSTLEVTLATINLTLLPFGERLDPVEVGTLCCPQATSLQQTELVDAVVFVAISQVLEQSNISGPVRQLLDPILAPLQGEILCEAFVQLKSVEAVPAPDDPEQNALEVFSAPFRVNLPADAGEGSWRSTPPRGEGSFNP
ncbi:hypothetical protein [Pseudomonas guineae]|uniref:hypothetical protein n=1 Tax=Pseudomonas guineae TaxID=425504 RepID=UPI0030EB37FF